MRNFSAAIWTVAMVVAGVIMLISWALALILNSMGPLTVSWMRFWSVPSWVWFWLVPSIIAALVLLKKKRFIAAITICIVTGLILVSALLDVLVAGFFLAFNVVGLVAFVYQGIRVIPADPPCRGVLTFLGRRQKTILKEGWCFLPLWPIIFDVIIVKVVKVNQDLEEQLLRTPDNAEVGVVVSITWTPGADPRNEELSPSEYGESFIAFLNSGEEQGIRKIFDDIIPDRLRGWAFSKEEGPATWEEAMAARDEAIAVLVKAILGDEISPINASIPTPVLMRAFNLPPQPPTEYQKRWGQQSDGGSMWEGLEKEFNALPDLEKERIKKAVEKRRQTIKDVRQGNGHFFHKAFGITINRFTINEILLKGRVAEAVEKKVKEQQEMAAETVEIQNVLERVQQLMKELKISAEQSLEVVQTERGKVVKTISEGKLNISPETRAFLEKLFPGLSTLFKGSKSS